MKKLIFGLIFGLTAALAHADLKIFATVPEWGALAREIGGTHVEVFTATTALQDPHRIEARPSLLARARQAQLVVATGAELEAGWLPLVLRDAGNAGIQPGRQGYFEAAAGVRLLDVPEMLDRAHGDVHAAGNPHLHLDPHNILRVGERLAERMATLDPALAAAYQRSWRLFAERWSAAMARWENESAALRGVPVLVHHESFRYLADWLGLRQVGTLEPKPGIEPTRGHLADLVARQQTTPARLVLYAAYQVAAPSRWMADKAGIPAIQLPYTVGGAPEAGDLFALFDDTLRRLRRELR